MKIIETAWLEYAGKCVPAGAGPDSVQYQATRQAFYAGATVMLMEQMKLTEADVTAPAAIKAMDSIAEELREFTDTLIEGQERKTP